MRVQQRGLLIGGAILLGVCLLGCVLVFVAGIPAFRNEVRDGVHDAVATEIARQVPPGSGSAPEGGSVTLTATGLEENLRETLGDDNNDQQLIVRITTAQVEVGITSQGQEAIYTGTPAAEDGELVMRDMETNNGFIEFLVSPDTIGGAIERAVNNHLSANNLRIDAVHLSDGEITLDIVPAS